MKTTCNSCGYAGEIDTFHPAMSINADCCCPKCGSTNNDHNAEYSRRLQKAWNCKHIGTLKDAGTGHGCCDLLECTECGSIGIAESMRRHIVSNVNVDLPDTAAQDSASKSNNPAVSG
jgi:hypothetical protein